MKWLKSKVLDIIAAIIMYFLVKFKSKRLLEKEATKKFNEAQDALHKKTEEKIDAKDPIIIIGGTYTL